MSLRMQIYNELVNKHSGIRERYMEVHCKQTPFSKINSYFVLLWLNVRYYILKDWTLDYIKIVRENEQKNLKTDVPESLFTTEYSATHILEAVKDYDIISFDIFDTLIFRPFSAPTDLFDYLAEEIGILDFKSVRIVQEWKARQDKFAVSGSYEVTLEEIWNRIECETGYPAGKGRNLEEELEQRFCYEVSVLSDDVVQLDTEDALYQYLKEQVVARNSQITVSVPIEINNKIGPVSAMTSAQEYTESCTGQEGDALKYGGVGYNVSTRSYTGATRVTYTYYMNYFSTAEQEKQLTSAVTCALASLNLNGKTDVEKVIAIHNYICDHVDYDYDGLSDSTNTVKYTAYGALCNGKAVCNGYAVLFYRMCKDAGLSVRIIPGTANGGGTCMEYCKSR